MTPLRIFIVVMGAATVIAVPISLAAEHFGWSNGTLLAVAAVLITPISLWGARRTRRVLDERERRAKKAGGTPAVTAR